LELFTKVKAGDPPLKVTVILPFLQNWIAHGLVKSGVVFVHVFVAPTFVAVLHPAKVEPPLGVAVSVMVALLSEVVIRPAPELSHVLVTV
jgi:hypothetical protein